MREGKREVADAHPAADGDGCEILVGERRHLERALHRHGLVLAELTTIQDPQYHGVLVLLHDLGQDRVEIDADEVADLKLVDDICRIETDAGLVARCGARARSQEPVLAHRDLAVGQRTGANLRALGVEAERNLRPLLNECDDPLEVIDLGVRQVETQQRRAEPLQPMDDLVVERCRTQRAQQFDFPSFHASHLLFGLRCIR